MFENLHATDNEVPPGCAYPMPYCGAAGFDPDNLLTIDRFEEEMATDADDLCWQCRSILA